MVAPESLLACLVDVSFDHDAIARELAAAVDVPWVRHFNEGAYDGDWTGLAVRSAGGEVSRIHPDPNREHPVQDTPLLGHLPATRDFLASSPFDVRAARFLRLSPGARIREHRDYDLGIDQGEARLHAVVRTDPRVRFVVGGVRLTMKAGELWYADFGLPHRVDNESDVDRVHLVIDCAVDQAFRDAIARSAVAIPRISAS